MGFNDLSSLIVTHVQYLHGDAPGMSSGDSTVLVIYLFVVTLNVSKIES